MRHKTAGIAIHIRGIITLLVGKKNDQIILFHAAPHYIIPAI
jgi:hypothetical protein